MTDELDNDLENDDLEGALDDEDEGAGDDSQGDEGPAGASASKGEGKRINDLMSKWQAAEARAKKAEDALNKKGDAGGAEAGGGNTELQQYIELFREQAREQAYRSDPRLAEYGIEVSSITGSTPSEMAESVKRAGALIDQMAQRIRDDVLKKHGLSPEVTSKPTGGRKSFDQMSDEEFEKELARAKANF